MLESNGLRLEGSLFRIFDIFLGLILLGFSVFDFISNVIFGQQEFYDVLGNAFASDLCSVFLSVLFAVLTDFGSSGDFDLDLFDWLFIAFEAHAVNI